MTTRPTGWAPWAASNGRISSSADFMARPTRATPAQNTRTPRTTAYLLHGRRHVLVDQSDRVNVGGEGLFGEVTRGLGIAIDHGLVELLQVWHKEGGLNRWISQLVGAEVGYSLTQVMPCAMLQPLSSGPIRRNPLERTNVNHHATQTEPRESLCHRPPLAPVSSLAAPRPRQPRLAATLTHRRRQTHRRGPGHARQDPASVEPPGIRHRQQQRQRPARPGPGGFTKLIHYAYDQGINLHRRALSYRTHEWIGAAIKGLPPRE